MQFCFLKISMSRIQYCIIYSKLSSIIIVLFGKKNQPNMYLKKMLIGTLTQGIFNTQVMKLATGSIIQGLITWEGLIFVIASCSQNYLLLPTLPFEDAVISIFIQFDFIFVFICFHIYFQLLSMVAGRGGLKLFPCCHLLDDGCIAVQRCCW